MNFFELMYSGTAIGIGCYIGVISMYAFTELIVFGIKQINKKQNRDCK